MEDEEDITLEIQDEGVTETPEPAEPEYITELKRQLEAERAGRAAAEQKLHQAARDVHTARSEVDETNLQLVVNAIDTVNRDIEMLSQAHTFALQSGDFDRATKLQREMSANEAKLLQLENGKQAMESAPRKPEPVLPPADPVEAFASQLSRRSADWVRQHPEFVKDARLNAKMIAAHNLAVADGIPADTDEYFGYVEEILQVKNQPRRDSDDDATSSAAKPVQRRSSPAAAPVSRNMNSTGGKPNVVTLTPEMREIAKSLGQTPEEYAKNRLALIREGRINSEY